MFRKVLNIALAALLFTPILDAQGTIGSNWMNTWGGSGPDVGNAVATDSTGNSYVAGSTSSFGAGGQDVLLTKYDPNGNLLWAKTWGGPSNDFANGVLVGGDGSVYVVGGTQSFGAGWYDVLILKFDSSGNLIWAHTWGGSSFDVGYDLSFDLNGNLVIAAESYSFGSCTVLLKMSTDGAVLSANTWKGPASYDSAYSITVDASGNTILAGISWDYSVSPEHNSILVLKYDSQGNLLWNRNWAGPGGDESSGRKTVRTDAQGNIYIAGRTTIVRGSSDFDVLLLKIDLDGNLLWSQKWGGTGYDTANALWIDSNYDSSVVGSTASVTGVQSALVQQYDSNGNILISKVLIPSSAQDPSELTSIVASPAGSFLAAGDAFNDAGLWQDTGISAVAASGSLSTPSGTVNTPTGTVGAPSGTISSPSGVIGAGGGGADVYLLDFSLGSSQPVLTVAANNASRPYGAANPAFSYTMSGFVNGDTQATATTGAPTLTTTAIATSASGTYPITITAGTLAAANYTFSLVPGTLNITHAGSSMTLTSSSPTIPFGSPVTFTATVNSNSGGTPTGIVAFSDVTTQSSIGAATLLANGTATFTTSSLALGAHSIMAQYSGDVNFTSSSSSGFTETVLTSACLSPTFAEVVANGVATPSTSQGDMKTTFTPGCGLTLKGAAALGGYDHFNWVQIITEHGGLAACQTSDPYWPSYFSLSPLCFIARGLVTENSTLPMVPFFDVPPGGFQYQVDDCTASGSTTCKFPVEDSLPWYWDENYTVAYQVAQGFNVSQAKQAACGSGTDACNSLSFEDLPSCHVIGVVPCTIRFTTALVGVKSDGSGDALNIGACQAASSINCLNNAGTAFTWHVLGQSTTTDGRLQNLQPDPDTTVLFDGFDSPGVAGFTQPEIELFAKSGIGIRNVGVTIPVIIDIKPGGFPNSINPKSNGKIPVAILSNAGFLAPTMIDPSTLTFGHTGSEHSLASCHPEDVNGDGLVDLVCQFYTSKAAFQASDTQGILEGKTFAGSPVFGTDSISIVPSN